jgi:hypothetical protein
MCCFPATWDCARSAASLATRKDPHVSQSSIFFSCISAVILLFGCTIAVFSAFKPSTFKRIEQKITNIEKIRNSKDNLKYNKLALFNPRKVLHSYFPSLSSTTTFLFLHSALVIFHVLEERSFRVAQILQLNLYTFRFTLIYYSDYQFVQSYPDRGPLKYKCITDIQKDKKKRIDGKKHYPTFLMRASASSTFPASPSSSICSNNFFIFSSINASCSDCSLERVGVGTSNSCANLSRPLRTFLSKSVTYIKKEKKGIYK